MGFKDNYTTKYLISKDTTCKEAKKVELSTDSYAVIEALEEVVTALSRKK